MAAVLVTRDQAKKHLYTFTTDGDVMDADLDQKLDAAEQLILSYCGTTVYWRPIVEAWTAVDVPPQVVAAILITFGELMRRRGDDDEGPPRDEGQELSAHVIGLLSRYHDPAFA